MIQNYLKIAWRNLLKHKSFSLINILGLAIGIGACLIIFLYVHDELTFDQYNVKADRIVRVTTRLHTPESDLVIAYQPDDAGRNIEKGSTRKWRQPSGYRMQRSAVKYNNEVFSEESFYKTEPGIFSVFSFDFLEGSPQHALQNPAYDCNYRNHRQKIFWIIPCAWKNTMVCNGENWLVTAL